MKHSRSPTVGHIASTLSHDEQKLAICREFVMCEVQVYTMSAIQHFDTLDMTCNQHPIVVCLSKMRSNNLPEDREDAKGKRSGEMIPPGLEPGTACEATN